MAMSATSILRNAATPQVPSADIATANDLPPHVQLIQMAVAIWTARAAYAAAKLRLPDFLADGPHTVADLAQAAGMDTAALYRLMRALASRGVFTEIEPQCFALTTLGAALKSGAPGGARAAILTLAGDWQWKAWDNFLFSLRSGKPALGAAFGMPLFDYLAAHPDDGALFNEAMIGMHGAVGAAVVEAYDFSRFRSVIDVGGGTGTLLRTILQANDNLRGTLFDLPDTIHEAHRVVSASGISARCECVAGNFFKDVPAGHDAYVMAHVLHDWTDEQALPILRNCRRAMGRDGRLLIVEAVLPVGDVPHHGKMMDLLMLTVTGGMERTADQFDSLLSAAGFQMTRIVATSTHQSIVEAIAA
jgi:ubiquinone/menaquinone biosynthesis C-methylase UbiE